MRNKFCPICGQLLSLKEIGDEGLMPFCNNCNKPVFDTIYPCVIVVVTYKGKILTIKQSYGKQNYVLVAGYIKEGFNAEQTVIKEVKEEVNLDVTNIRYVNSYYHDGGSNLMLGFVCEALSDSIKLSSEVKEASFDTYENTIIRLNDAKIALKLVNDTNLKNYKE